MAAQERSMARPLLNLVDNFTEGFHKIKHKNRNKCCLDYTNFSDGLLEFKYWCCHKNYPENFDENLKEKQFNT